MEDNTKKNIWLTVKRRYLGEDVENSSAPELQCISISGAETGNQIKQQIYTTCQLQDHKKLVLKLRNHRGSIIPITAKIPANTNNGPYILEIVQEHQFIKPQQRSVKLSYGETMKDKITDIFKRVDKLETAAPSLGDRRNVKIQKEMEELHQTLEFLNKRFSDAETVHWKGMFKKNPLW